MSIEPKKLLRDKRVIDEIKRHKWLESEIAGYDIGFEKAAEDWLKKYSNDWITYHQSHQKKFKNSPSKKKKSK